MEYRGDRVESAANSFDVRSWSANAQFAEKRSLPQCDIQEITLPTPGCA
jgi:hypothetical protein